MTAAVTTPASTAVERQLKTLCLREFPCGLGAWREPGPDAQQYRPTRRGRLRVKPLQHQQKSDTDSLDSIKTHAQKEKSESLQELVSSHFSPWHLDYSWSEEAKKLREIAVKSPWLIDQNFVLNYFKTLRIVDKNVSEVDHDLLMLKNLEELTLSANFITNVNSKNLPPSLRVLELCANQISDVSGLCVRPPLLHHLGIGHNKISFIGDYITGDFWPNLLSLDLSHNDLCDLMDIVRKMTTLPRLRNLILQGNPLSLIPGYRGYTIDSLRRLSVMDDIHISADEKHHFKGLSRRREFILDEARVQISVSYIKGLPCPEEIKNPEGQPEFPVVERTYFVQFMFPEEPEVRPAEDDGAVDDMADLTALEMEAAAAAGEHQDDPSEHSPTRIGSSNKSAVETPAPLERNVQINSRPEVKSVAPPASYSVASFPRANPNPDPEVLPGSEVEGISLDFVDESQVGEGEDGQTARQEEAEPTPRIKLAPVNTEPQPWGEELELNWMADLTRDDLLGLRDFFKQGMDFSVVEQVVLGYPAEPDTSSEKTDGKDGKDKKKAEVTPKGKNSAKDKKKKKEPEIELVKSPATYTTIATFHITLDQFLEGEFEYHNIFTKGDVPPPSTIRSIDPEDKKVEKKDSKDKKKPDKAADKKKDQNANAKKSPRGKEADKKGAKGKHAEEAEEEDLPPPPLELEVSVKLHHWVTAMDSVREEEEKNRALQEAKGKGPQSRKESLKPA
ncbi:leucine-rich repeat-containing protein 43 [Aplysia californica]|uniref:Leucine-rich repeat-containing protein 43 n=1 Tax=Aplysia californica TaxID=6500 RepID=A0ABM0JE25_APLCA|nr:leucine-rich repeat-containing protein 43 [Aplysia californica]